MKSDFDITALTQLDEVVAALSGRFRQGVFYLAGDLGSGKTAFVRTWLRHLGFRGVVNSPTFPIMQEYTIGDITVIHADLYRLSEPDELIYLDVRDWKSRAALIFIEWPQQGEGFLPAPDVICQFKWQPECRFLSVQTNV